ncbi:hypothetical protein VCRA2119O147_1520002 [Vibrio crassostreae]|uniref:Uncharacterized protein n=1 Tax=Vibrio crassostreae TaxID=246167 RepID=A0A822N365_9VIBR|nr:hypothetical protein VCRA2114E123_170097 [Vibrio crassostreae]CAK1828864.1 hypothetical protein VCRA2113O119_180097 [Vibrio crassostreae]CAK1830438.1 hypothetical protein VCRA2110O113_180098 [Vibrio crassostreae]CAK1850564.1 hypothetical protein VCRA2110O1_10274 [Vibrio crassostreae]CAK1854971.1 hypothetical protein VCRA2114E5_10107 [Vibrio crassostreae]
MPSADNIINEYRNLIVRIIFIEWINRWFEVEVIQDLNV